MWGGGSEHGVETTVHCTTGGCLYQYQMRMYEEYGSGTCHWNTQMTQCTHSTIPPLCPPYMADCKLTNAYNVMMPVSDSLPASADVPRATAFAGAFAAVVAAASCIATWQRARRIAAASGQVDETFTIE